MAYKMTKNERKAFKAMIRPQFSIMSGEDPGFWEVLRNGKKVSDGYPYHSACRHMTRLMDHANNIACDAYEQLRISGISNNDIVARIRADVSWNDVVKAHKSKKS